jgi:hypothetical protein
LISHPALSPREQGFWTEAELPCRRAVARHPRIRREMIPTTVLDPDQRSSKGRHHSVRRSATRPWSHAATVTPVPLPDPEPSSSDAGQRISRRLKPAPIRNNALDGIAPERNQQLVGKRHNQHLAHASTSPPEPLGKPPG